MKIFNSLGHFFAWVISKISAGTAEAEKVATAVGEAASSPIATALAGLAGAKGGQVQADIEAVAGSVVAFATSSAAALGSGFLNGALDAAALAALERLIATVGGAVGKGTTPAPVAPTPAAG